MDRKCLTEYVERDASESISSRHPSASLCSALNQLLDLLWGRKWEEKAFVAKSLAVRQSVHPLDSKRLSHEGLISAASQFCRKIKQQCEGKIGQKNKKALKWACSSVCLSALHPCLKSCLSPQHRMQQAADLCSPGYRHNFQIMFHDCWQLN